MLTQLLLSLPPLPILPLPQPDPEPEVYFRQELELEYFDNFTNMVSRNSCGPIQVALSIGNDGFAFNELFYVKITISTIPDECPYHPALSALQSAA